MVDQAGFVLGLDAGTQSVKAGLWDLSGALVGRSAFPIPVRTPRPGWAEQDPEAWWPAVGEAIRSVRDAAPRARVRALGVAWQRETFTLTDLDGRVLRPALLWLDVRAFAEAAALEPEATLLRALTGVSPDVTTCLPRMQWLRTNEPEHFARPVVWADVGSRLLEALTGRSVTCRAGADTTGMIELVGGDWSEAVLGRAGLARSSLPGLVGPGEVVGPLLPDAARELGLDPGTPVVAAGGDGQVFATCALGGRLDPSACTLTLGTSVVLALPSLTSTTSPLYRTLRAARPGGGWLQEAVIQSGTYLARWLERLSGVAVADSLESVASGLPPGSAGLLCVPNWWGARFPESHPQARGATLGWADHHNAAHLYRSLVEGVAFELRYLLGEMQGHGPPPRRVVVGGGAADSPLWRSVLRDVLGLDMDVAAPEAVTLGAALLAAVGCGAFGTLEQASDRFPSAQETTSPDTAAHTMYERLFQEVYLPFRQVSTTLSARLAHLTAGT